MITTAKAAELQEQFVLAKRILAITSLDPHNIPKKVGVIIAI